MPGISTVIITHNEEKHIANCINSVFALSDEIIILDSFSDDRTAQICQSFPNVIFQQRYFTNHGDQKNFANSLAQHPYILSLDADEILSPQLTSFLIAQKKDLHADAYQFNRLNHIGSKSIHHGLWYPDKKIRLFKKSIGHWETDILHEKILLKEGAHISTINFHILHHAYDNIDAFRKKSLMYAQIWAETKHKQGKQCSLISAVAHAKWTFFRAFVLKGAFLNGIIGIQIALQNTKETYLKYKHLRSLTIHD